MAVTVATLIAKLEAQTGRFNAEIQGAENRLRGLNTAAGGASGAMRTMGNAMRAAAASGAVYMAAELFKLGVKAEAWGRRYETVFQGVTDEMNTWIEEQGSAFGVADEHLKGMAAAVGDLFVPMGFARDAAADMTQKVLILANALSEWTGGTQSAEEATNTITRAILGEREALIGLGVEISEADVQARLVAKGQDELTGAALEQARAIATLELITGKSADALAAYEAGGSDAMRASKDLAAAFEDAKIQAGELLIALAPLISAFADLIGVFTDVAMLSGTLFAKLFASPVDEFLARMASRVTDTFAKMREAATIEVPDVDEAMERYLAAQQPRGRQIESPTSNLEFAIRAANAPAATLEGHMLRARRHAEGLASALLGITNPIVGAARAVENLASVETQIIDPAGEGGRAVTSLERLARAEAWAPVQAFLEELQDMSVPAGIEAMALAMGVSRMESAQILTNLGLLTGGVWTVPVTYVIKTVGDPLPPTRTSGAFRFGGGVPPQSFHSGGIVPGLPGANVPIIAQAGETIIPRGRSSGGITVIVNNAGSVISERDLLDSIRRGLRSDRIRGGSLEF